MIRATSGEPGSGEVKVSSLHPGRPVWRLRGLALRDVQCWVAQQQYQLFTVRVIHGDETMLDEMYPDLESALARADRLRAHLAGAGWNVIAAAPRPSR